MKITILGVVLGLLLLIIPLYTIYYFRLRLMHRFAKAFARMFLGVAIMAVLVYSALLLNSVVYDIVVFLILALVSSAISLGKAQLKVSKLIVPVGIGTTIASAAVGFYFAFLVLGEKNPFLPNIFIPLFGIIIGGMTGANTKALQSYYSGLLNHGQLYNYIIGNGGTHREATQFFLRRSLQTSIVSVSKQMSRFVVMTAPVVLFAMVMSGADVLTAFALQVLIYVAVVAASLIALFIAIFIGKKYSFDEYERLKPVFKDKKPRETETATADNAIGEQSASDSSSSLSESQHIDSESQQQEL